MSKKILFKVRDFVVREGSIYKIIGKPDTNAPDGLVQLGTTKIPSPMIANDVSCRWKMTNKANGSGLYDTGLYAGSPCYMTMDKDEIKERLQLLEENLVEPFERTHEEGVLHQANLDFWDNYRIRLNQGRIFNTKNVEDLLDMFIALNSYELTPKEHVGNPAYKGSQFCIEDSTKVQDIENEVADLSIQAIGHYVSLKEENPQMLKNILRYIGLTSANTDIDLNTLSSVIFKWINSDNQNPKKFEDAYELATNPNTQNIVDYYTMIGDLATYGVVSRENGFYTYNGINLGADLKSSAKYLNSKKKDIVALAIELTTLYQNTKNNK